MAQYFYDLSLTKPGGNSWPHGFSYKGLSPSELNGIRSAAGTKVLPETGFSIDFNEDNLWLALMTEHDLADGEVLLKMRMHRMMSVSYYNTGSGVLVRSGRNGGSTGGGYYASFGSAGDKTNNYLCIYRRAESGQVNLYNSSGGLTGSGNDIENFRYIRFRFEGETLKVKGWWEGYDEPSSWAKTITDTGETSGLVGILAHGYDALSTFMFFSVGTDGDSAPMEPPISQISGIASDLSGIPAARKVTAYHRPTRTEVASTTSDPETGVFSMQVQAGLEYYVIAFDEDGGEENALIYDRIGTGGVMSYQLPDSKALSFDWSLQPAYSAPPAGDLGFHWTSGLTVESRWSGSDYDVLVAWGAVDEATSYQLTLQREGGTVDEVTASVLSHVFRGILPKTSLAVALTPLAGDREMATVTAEVETGAGLPGANGWRRLHVH